MADSIRQGGRVEPTLDGPRSTHSEWRLPDSSSQGRIVSFFKRRPKPRREAPAEPSLERRVEPAAKPAPKTPQAKAPEVEREPEAPRQRRDRSKEPRRAKVPTARRSLWASPITRRILLLNVVALAPLLGSGYAVEHLGVRAVTFAMAAVLALTGWLAWSLRKASIGVV